MPPRVTNLSKESFLAKLDEKIAWTIKNSGKIENRKISLRTPQAKLLAKNNEKQVKNKKEINKKKVKVFGIITFLFFKELISQIRNKSGIIILTDAKSTPSVGLRAI